MKIKKIYALFFTSFIFFSACSNIQTLQKNTAISFGGQYLSDCSTPIEQSDTVTIAEKAIIGTFEILSIKKTKDAYIIMTTKSDSLAYQIVSVKSRVKKGHKIKVGEKYKLIINPYYKGNCMPGGHIYPVIIKGKTLYISREAGLNIYTTPNLDGLYYKR